MNTRQMTRTIEFLRAEANINKQYRDGEINAKTRQAALYMLDARYRDVSNTFLELHDFGLSSQM